MLHREDPKGNTYKNVVLTDYKNTPFAKIILNPDKELKDEQVDEIEALYKIAYNLYKDASFENTMLYRNHAPRNRGFRFNS